MEMRKYDNLMRMMKWDTGRDFRLSALYDRFCKSYESATAVKDKCNRKKWEQLKITENKIIVLYQSARFRMLNKMKGEVTYLLDEYKIQLITAISHVSNNPKFKEGAWEDMEDFDDYCAEFKPTQILNNTQYGFDKDDFFFHENDDGSIISCNNPDLILSDKEIALGLIDLFENNMSGLCYVGMDFPFVSQMILKMF